MKKKNIFLVIADCLRADYAYGAAGQTRITTLEQLKKRGVSFSEAVATSSATSPNIADIMTGCYPFLHGIRGLFGYKLNPGLPTLAQILQQNGFNTHAMLTGPLIPQLGLDRGFDEYEFRDSRDDFGFGLEEKVIRKLSQLHSPWFLVLHTWIMHSPRRVPDFLNNNTYGKTQYERAVSAFDHYLAEILHKIKPEDTTIILTGDHGESLKTGSWTDMIRLAIGKIHKPTQNKMIMTIKSKLVRIIRKIRVDFNMNKDGVLTQPGHGFHIYEYLIKVPLIIVAPGVIPQNKEIDGVARHIDILPTILDLAKIPCPVQGPHKGRSLLPLINGDTETTDAEAFLMASGESLIEENNWLYGIRTSRHKYIYSLYQKGYEELYDLSEDPAETRNIAGKYPDLARSLREKTERMRLCESVFRMNDDEQAEVARVLKDLGYM